jgi:thiamine pyrophosphokinase
VTAVILVGGTVVATEALRARTGAAGLVVAADGGLRHAAALGLAPDLLVGDLDSVDAATRARYPELATEAHPADKDALDLELALDAAAARGATGALIVGGLSGRLDQTLATVAIAQARRAGGMAVDVADGVRSVWPLRPGETRRLALVAGARFSLLALDAVSVVSVAGARYPLERSALHRARGRGVSNEALGRLVVTAHAGALVVVEPGSDERLGSEAVPDAAGG